MATAYGQVKIPPEEPEVVTMDEQQKAKKIAVDCPFGAMKDIHCTAPHCGCKESDDGN